MQVRALHIAGQVGFKVSLSVIAVFPVHGCGFLAAPPHPCPVHRSAVMSGNGRFVVVTLDWCVDGPYHWGSSFGASGYYEQIHVRKDVSLFDRQTGVTTEIPAPPGEGAGWALDARAISPSNDGGLLVLTPIPTELFARASAH